MSRLDGTPNKRIGRAFSNASNHDTSILSNSRKRPLTATSPLAKRRLTTYEQNSISSPLKSKTDGVSITKENHAGQLTAAQLQSLYDTLDTRTQESKLLRKQISLKDKELAGLKSELVDVSDLLTEIERNVTQTPGSLKASVAKAVAKKNNNDSDHRVAQLRQELSKRDESIFVQQKKVESLQELNEASKAEIDRIVSYGETLQMQFDNLALEKKELEGKLEDIKETRDKQIKTLVEELEKRSALLKQYRDMLGNVDEENGELMVDGKRYSDLKMEAEMAQRKLESLERAHRDARESLLHLRNEKSDMEERWQRLHERLDEREKEYEIVEKKAEESEYNLLSNLEKVKVLERKIGEYETELDNITNDRDDLEARRRHLEEELARRNRQYEQALNAKDEMEEKLEKLTLELESKDELEVEKLRFEQALDDQQQAYQELEAEKRDIEQQLNDQQAAYENVTTQKRRFEQQLHDQQEAYDDLLRERDELEQSETELKRRLTESSTSKEVFVTEKRRLEQQLEQQQQAFEDLLNEATELESKERELRIQLSRVSVSGENAEVEKRNLEQQLIEQQAAYEELDQEREHLQRNERDLKRRISELTASKDDLTTEKNQLEQALTEQQRAYDQLDHQKHSLQSKESGLQRQLDDLKLSYEDVEAERRHFEQQLIKQQQAFNHLEQERDSRRSREVELQRKLTDLNVKADTMTAEKRRMEELLDEQQQQYQQLVVQRDDWSTREAELRKQLTRKEMQYKNMEKSLQDKTVVSKQEMELQQKTLADYKRQLTEARSKLTVANGKANEYEIEIAKANEATRERTLKIGELEQKVDQIKRELEGALSQRRQVAHVIMDLEQRLQSADGDKQDAEDRASNMEKAAKLLRDERDEFRKDLDKLKRLYEQQNKQYIEKVKAREHEISLLRQKQNDDTHALAESLKEKDSQIHELARDLARYKQVYQAACDEKNFAERSRDDCIADAQMLKEECLKQIRLLEQRLVHQGR